MPLETPLFATFIGENKRLIFAPAKEYLALVGICFVGGAALCLDGLIIGSQYWSLVGAAVSLGGVWAALSLQWISFDVRRSTRMPSEGPGRSGERLDAGTYLRRQGPGTLFPKTTRGSISDLEAIFLLAEEQHLFRRQVTYRLVLQWKHMAQTSMVLQQDCRGLAPGAPLSSGGGRLGQVGLRAATMLGLHYVDHSFVHTANPIPVH